MFSIIIPLYNKAKYIEKAIASVLSQTYKEFELIIVDDGSTDNGLSIVQKIDCSGFNVKIIIQENTGVATARNNGVKSAKYDYIAFLDADDWWEPTFLEEMKKVIEKYPEAGILGCDFYYVKNGNFRINNIGVDKCFEMGFVEYMELLMQGNCRPVCTGSCVIKKTVFNAVGCFNPNYKFGEDFDLYYRVYLESKLVLINKPLMYYNQDVDNENRAIKKYNLCPKEQTAFLNLDKYIEKYDDRVILFIGYLKLKSFYPYFLKKMYEKEITLSLCDIKWKNYSFNYFLKYKIIPIWLQNFYLTLRQNLSKIKQYFIRVCLKIKQIKY